MSYPIKQMKKMDFLVIGAMKAGTTWIYENLKEHPEICLNSNKEIHFFVRIPNYKKGMDYFFSFYEQCPNNKIKGEICPGYLDSSIAPQLIYKNFPNMKIIACLRNPIERAYSHYKYAIERKGLFSIYRNFESATKNVNDLIDKGLYYKHLKNYFDLFPRQNILILFFKDLRGDPLNFLKKIFNFLGVNDDFVPSNLNQKILKTGNRVFSPRIPFINAFLFYLGLWVRKHTLLNKLSTIAGLEMIFEKITNLNKKVVNKENVEVLSISSMKKDTRDNLDKIYRSDINQLKKLLELDLDFWK